jgi:hypothetical protein
MRGGTVATVWRDRRTADGRQAWGIAFGSAEHVGIVSWGHLSEIAERGHPKLDPNHLAFASPADEADFRAQFPELFSGDGAHPDGAGH